MAGEIAWELGLGAVMGDRAASVMLATAARYPAKARASTANVPQRSIVNRERRRAFTYGFTLVQQLGCG